MSSLEVIICQCLLGILSPFSVIPCGSHCFGGLEFRWPYLIRLFLSPLFFLNRLATGWMCRRLNPGAVEIFRTRPDRPWDPPSPLYDGYQVIPGTKVAVAWP